MVFRRRKDEEEDEEREKGARFTVRGRDPFDDLFVDFDRMEETVNEIMRSMVAGISRAQAGKPYVYGFSMKTGPDGKPVIREFGDVKSKGKPAVAGAREPLVDVIGREKEIIVVAELPGVSKEDVQLDAGRDSLEITVDTPGKKYYKEVQLPGEVEEDATDASYKNGVLEVKLKRKKAKKGKRTAVK